MSFFIGWQTCEASSQVSLQEEQPCQRVKQVLRAWYESWEGIPSVSGLSTPWRGVSTPPWWPGLESGQDQCREEHLVNGAKMTPEHQADGSGGRSRQVRRIESHKTLKGHWVRGQSGSNLPNPACRSHCYFSPPPSRYGKWTGQVSYEDCALDHCQPTGQNTKPAMGMTNGLHA